MIYDLSSYTYNGNDIPMEFWKPITNEMVPNIKPIYWISNIGNVYNAETGKYFTRTNLSSDKYIRLSFVSIDGSPCYESLHRLVCMAFNSMPPTKSHEVDHINCDKSCSYEGNLEWVSSSENKLRAISNNLYSIGENYYKAILTNDDVEIICQMLSQGIEISKIASYMEEYIKPRVYPGGLKSLIYSILYRETWKSVSYKYQFHDYNRINFTEDEIHSICKLLEDGTRYDDILKIIGRWSDNKSENDNLKNTISRLRYGHIYTDISSKYNINKLPKRSLTDDEREYVCKCIAEGMHPKVILDTMSRGNEKPVRQSVFDIYRGTCFKDKVDYYKSKLESSTTIPKGSTLK